MSGTLLTPSPKLYAGNATKLVFVRVNKFPFASFREATFRMFYEDAELLTLIM